MTKTIRSGNRLRYPIIIVRLEKSSGDRIKKGDRLFQYSFKWMREVGDFHSGDTWQQEQTTITDFPCPVDGKLQEWRIKEGDVIPRDQALLDAEEDCSHEIQVHGLCAICGKDMTEVSWATDSRDTDRAPINMTHDQTSLLVSKEHAQKAERELQSRLLEQRKLSLVVDLDQTIIHACIEPTIGDWQRDPNNPNYEALKDVKSFQLSDDGPRGLTSGCWYYIKLRPGLEEFLNKVASNYELHVYTMGTRTYAQNIAKLVDPQGKLFGNRVISRDENGNMTAKSLQRLFPVSTNMVVIIDDRSDVWPRNRPNLIKVTPYDFFKGVGDINSSFLPQRADLLTPSPSPEPTPAQLPEKEAQAGASKPSSVSPVADLVAMSGADDPALAKRQTEEQARELEKQIKERPLLHMQEKLDKEDEEAERTTPETESGDYNETPGAPPHQRHRLLLDNDHELPYLEQHLTSLHKRYYEEYDRVASQSSVLPDVGKVLDSLKAQVLKGTKVVLSGLVPIGVDVRRSEIGLQVSSFGAELRDRVSRDITHLVVSSARPRTQKVRQAARFPSIKIVNQDWLAECLTQWQRVDERPYLVEIHPADRKGVKEPGSEVVSTENTDAEPVSDADDTDDTVAVKPRPLRIKPSPSGLGISPNGDADEEPDSEDDDIDEDEEGLMPSDILDGQLSPVDDLKTFDWDSAGAELQDFLGSDDDDDDEDEDEDEDADENVDGEVDNDEEEPTKKDATTSRKRKHSDDDDNGSEADSVDELSTGSSKKQRLSTDQPASYHVANTSSLPTPQITGDEQEVNGVSDNGQAKALGNGNDNFEIDDADFEADLEAELEREFAEEFDEEEEDNNQTANADDSKGQNDPSENG
jgi:RNA polymerase II subunit A-like phosphatase